MATWKIEFINHLESQIKILFHKRFSYFAPSPAKRAKGMNFLTMISKYFSCNVYNGKEKR